MKQRNTDTQNLLLILAGLKLIAKTLRLSVLTSLFVLCAPLLIYSLIPADWNILTLAIYSVLLSAYAVGTSKYLDPAKRNYTHDTNDSTDNI